MGKEKLRNKNYNQKAAFNTNNGVFMVNHLSFPMIMV